LDPNNVAAHIQLAKLLSSNGVRKYELAMTHAHRALELDSQNAQSHLAYAMALFDKERASHVRYQWAHDGFSSWRIVGEVRQAARKAAELSPDDPEILNFLAFVDLARSRFYSAIRGFVSVLQVDPQNAYAAENLATVMTKHFVRLYRILFGFSLVVYWLMFNGALGDQPSLGVHLLGHIVMTVVAASVIWFVVAHQILRPLSPSMRSAAVRFLRRDRANRPLFYGMAWIALGTLFFTTVAFWPYSRDTGLDIQIDLTAGFLVIVGFFVFSKWFKRRFYGPVQKDYLLADIWAAIVRGDYVNPR